MDDLGFVHRFVPAEKGSNRVLLLLHGTGADESNLLPIGRALDENAALLSPRGKVLENGAPRFFRRHGEGLFDEEDVVRRAHELADFVTAAANKYAFEAEKMIFVGYSNGANIAAAMMLLRPEVVRAAILFRAMVGLTSPPTPDLKGTRVLISNGAKDPIIPLSNGERLAALFRDRGAEVTFLTQPANHSLTRDDLVAAVNWLSDAVPKSIQST
jgi:phospholipase/carboxylesterase